MGDSKAGNELEQGSYYVDDNERISRWIRQIDHKQSDEDVSELGATRAVAPVTPLRRPTPLLCYDEPSPTNTSFSGGSIFDNPQTLHDSWNDDPFRDDISDATSVNNENEYPETKSKQFTPIFTQNIHAPGSIAEKSRLASGFSYGPPSEPDTDLQDELGDFTDLPVAPQSAPVSRDKPRIVWLTSCLQCTLAGLPCSRTTPSCSRCLRAGKGSTCLLYRRKFREEIDASDAETCTVPVLLKLKDEDSETWKEKLKLAEEVNSESCSRLLIPS
jgi:hypothetical protein